MPRRRHWMRSLAPSTCATTRAGLIRYNSEAAALWGRTPNANGAKERFCGSHRLFLPDGTPLRAEDCPMADAVRSGTATRNAEVIMERPDGSRFTALVNIRALKDLRGNIQGAINCFQDISAHKEMEDEVRRKSNDLEDFFENSAVGLHIVSGEGIILRANQAELDLLGYRPRNTWDATSQSSMSTRRSSVRFFRGSPAVEKLDRHPARLRAKNGSIKDVLITSNSRFDERQVYQYALLHDGRDRICERPSARAGRARNAWPQLTKQRRSALPRLTKRAACCA